MHEPLLRATLILFLLIAIGWLLFVGRPILLPFVLALIIWYVISLGAQAFRELPVLGAWLPGWIRLALSLLTILLVVFGSVRLVAANVATLAADVPEYQARLEALLRSVSQRFGIEDELRLDALLPDNALNQLVGFAAEATTTLLGSGAIILIYVAFLLVEQTTFRGKTAAMFSTLDGRQRAQAVLEVIAGQIRNYLAIKTASSVLVGLITSAFVVIIGMPYAALFGFLAFVLNFIPTIGSILGVVGPAILAIVYFDSLGPFVGTVVVLGALQFIAGNVLEPRLMGSQLNLSAVVIFLSLAFWGALWGVVGMIVCVPITVMMLIVFAQFSSTRPLAVLLSSDGKIPDRIEDDGITGRGQGGQ